MIRQKQTGKKIRFCAGNNDVDTALAARWPHVACRIAKKVKL
jgi:hypothetical protein